MPEWAVGGGFSPQKVRGTCGRKFMQHLSSHPSPCGRWTHPYLINTMKWSNLSVSNTDTILLSRDYFNGFNYSICFKAMGIPINDPKICWVFIKIAITTGISMTKYHLQPSEITGVIRPIQYHAVLYPSMCSYSLIAHPILLCQNRKPKCKDSLYIIGSEHFID